MSRQTAVVAVALLALGVAPLRAQEKEPAGTEPAVKAEKADARSEQDRFRWATLRVQLVISRYQGEKKTGSLPYTFVVAARGLRTSAEGGLDRVRMRMGVDTPVPTAAPAKAEGEPRPPVSFQYRNVGTNIDCFARDFGDGRYQLNLTVENSSAIAGSERSADVAAAGAPLFRRFETSLNPLLRDGQTIQTIASTDPVTGEVVKIDVTLSVLK
jgi:hypothetical protein